MGAYTACLDLALGLASPALGLVAGGAGLGAVFLASALVVLGAASSRLRLWRRRRSSHNAVDRVARTTVSAAYAPRTALRPPHGPGRTTERAYRGSHSAAGRRETGMLASASIKQAVREEVPLDMPPPEYTKLVPLHQHPGAKPLDGSRAPSLIERARRRAARSSARPMASWSTRSWKGSSAARWASTRAGCSWSAACRRRAPYPCSCR